ATRGEVQQACGNDQAGGDLQATRDAERAQAHDQAQSAWIGAQPADQVYRQRSQQQTLDGTRGPGHEDSRSPWGKDLRRRWP
ncbi:unnamed protein product, partial [Ascophyllum nodosum]